MDLYHVLTIILVGLQFSFKEANAQYDCEKYCHKDCQQYWQGPEFSPCVEANVHCNCGLPPNARIPLIIIGVVVGIMILLGCVIRCCRREMHNGTPRFVAGPIQPNSGVGPNYSQPVTTHYPYAPTQISGVPVSTQVPYNTGYTNFNFNEGLPSYWEVVRENTNANQSKNLG